MLNQRFFHFVASRATELPLRPGWMRSWRGAVVCRVLIAAIICGGGVSIGQELAAEAKNIPAKCELPSPSAAAAPTPSAAVALARERAEMLHEIYSATLMVMHQHYFHSDVAVVPARAMEDIFEDIAGLYGDKAHWISVNTKAMSIDHRPTTDFEKQAATQLSTGKNQYELVEKGIYQRAAVIRLGTNCVGCHVGRFSQPPKSPRAGLVISIPLQVAEK